MSIVYSKPTITRKELESVLDCLFNNELTIGKTNKAFESLISNTLDIKYSLTTNSLTSAYHLAIKALDINPGDEVILPSYFPMAPLSALTLTGAKIILIDVDENMVTPSYKQVAEKITPNTKLIILGHLFGYPMEMDNLLETKIPVIEDISHIIGTEAEQNTPIGKTGTISVASFDPSTLITTGNGAVSLTQNSKLYSTMRELRSNNSTGISYDYAMTDFQGAMGISQLSKLGSFIKRRREIAKKYYDALKLTPHKSPFNFNEACTYQSFPIIFDASSEKVEKYWKKNGIEITKPIEKPLHGYLDLKPMDFPNSDRLSKKLYSLPIYPSLTQREIEKISRLLAKFI